jgi:hypothetical protein
MSLLVQLLIAIALIVGLIGLRLFAEHRALQEKIRGGYINECNEEECMSCALKTTQRSRAFPRQS